ncbi:beta strand repeat-containing protein [Herminiimonas contaminans]|uniref:Hemolysin type calcium-binding protein n=1 Tax=Herminiimonas contaminans TaxID=1111140 RepID=A0ABS0EQH5_9BURK|nr:hypothetical protein [Herminiimonas contaminans]MBF8177102.1 hypothetical protein [Herminiimonas contaminans]
MATAPVSKSANNQPALDKNGAPIRVVTPDQQGNFQLKISKGDIAKVHIVDVDMVLYLNDGTKLVLAGGAIGAMDDSVMVDFSNGRDSAAHMMDQVGIIPLQKLDQPRVLSTEPRESDGRGNMQEDASYRQTEGAQDLAAQAQAANAAISAISKAMVQLANVVQSNATPVNNFKSNYEGQASQQQPLIKPVAQVLPERPGVTPQEFVIGPNAPALSVHLVNTIGTTQDGNILKGSGGSSAFNSDTNTSNIAQIAPQIINAGNDVNEIWANGQAPLNPTTPDNTFSKILNVQITGDGKVQSLTITAILPPGVSIVGATSLGNNVYQIPVSPDTKDYRIELRYDTVPPNPNAPIHADFKLNFELTVITTEGIQVLNSVRQVVIKDATTADDLNYANPVTGESALVLPAQGVAHVVRAGDNAGTTIYGSNANDSLYGGTGNDTLYGGKGNTYFEGGAGNDTIVGGVNGGVVPNINTVGYTNSTSGVRVDLNTGIAQDGFGGTDTLHNIQKVIGSTHDDTFIVGANTKGVDGGTAGNDTIDFSASNAAVTVNLTTGTGTGGYAQNVTFTNIENVVGSNYNDTFVGSNVANKFDGGGGAHNLVNYSGDTADLTIDLLTPGAAGIGGSAAGDTYVNIQDVTGGSGNDTFVASLAANNFDGGGGTNTVSYAGSATGVKVDFYRGEGTGGTADGDTYKNIQSVIGSSFDDIFTADPNSVKFDGGAGGFDTVSYDRSLSGIIVDASRNVGGIETAPADPSTPGSLPTYSNSYTNIDKFIGSAYADTFIASNRADNFDGLGGVDTVSYAADTVGVVVNLVTGQGSGAGSLAEGDTLANIENVTGGSGNDTFVANDSANVFDGGAGSNTVDYSASTTGAVTVDLFHANGVGTSGGFAQGDKFINIQNVIGSGFDDTFVASAAANTFDGGGGTHNRVSYANDTVGVTVDLVNGQGSGAGSLADGDKFFNIQDATGGSGNDTFIASNVANAFNGGLGTNTVSYEYSDVGVTVDLVTGTGTGGYADGDILSNIQNVKGSTSDDLFIANNVANSFVGNGGVDTVSYIKATDGNGVTVDLNAGVGTGGYAEGDRYDGIRNATGTSYDDTFVASNLANTFDGGLGSNTVSYAASDSGVTVNLLTGMGTGGYAQDDRYISIQNVVGSASDDLFIANGAVNRFDGGVSTATSHNRVSYATDTADLTIDLLNAGVAGIGGNAEGDTYVNIQDVTGGLGNDTFIASAAANNFDGGGGTHNRVSYATDTANLTIDLFNAGAIGQGGNAQGDTYTNIQDITGGLGNDTFIANAAANAFDGGGGTHNRVSYTNDSADLIVNLSDKTASGVAAGSGSGGMAAGDTYTNIQDATGGSGNDTFVASLAENNFDGGGGSNTVSYASSVGGVTVNLSSQTVGGVASNTGSGNYAAGDTYTNIQNVIGSTGNDTFIGGAAVNTFTGNGGIDTVSYAASTAGVKVNLSNAVLEGVGIGRGVGGDADNDRYVAISNVTGTLFDDVFFANNSVNTFDGGGGTLHNRVSYAASGTGIIVNLSDKAILGVNAGRGSLGEAAGDTYINIQDVTGTSGNDTFIASAAENVFDGGGGVNTMNYGASDVGVIVNLSAVTQNGVASLRGSGGYANNDAYTNIQNVTGSLFDDLFYGSSVENIFDGGGGTLHNRVSYANDTVDLVINLSDKTASGANAGKGLNGNAAGDTYINIQDATGGSGNDTFVASLAENNFDGGGGSNTVSYASSVGGVTVNLSSQTVGGVASNTGSGNYAAGDTYTNIQNVIGSTGNDTFIGGAAVNTFTGNGGIDTVSYAASTAGVKVNLSNAVLEGVGIGRGVGGDADNDRYVAISNVTGTLFDDVFFANNSVNTFDGGGGTLHNRVSYAASGTGIIVNLSDKAILGVNAGRGSLGEAAGDTYINIQDVTGTSGNDTFIASAAENIFDGGGGVNTVNYGASDVGVIVNLSAVTQNGVASLRGSGGYANNDAYTNIQNVTGSLFDDLFYGSSVANIFDGGGGTLHNRVSYAGDTANLTIDLIAGTGLGGNAEGDKYISIQDATGGSGDDTFIASAVANNFDGGGGSNTVSYAGQSVAVKVNLSSQSVSGVAANTGSGGFAAGDTYTNIQNAIGGKGDDTLIGASTGRTVLTGGLGNDTLIGIAANSANTYASYAGSDVGVTVNLLTGVGANGHAAGDTLTNIDNVIGSSLNDTFIGNSKVNIFDGGTGGTDNLGGNDTVSYAGSNGAVIANLNTTVGSSGNATGDVYIRIENLTGSDYDDTLTGLAAGGSILTGGLGADKMYGLGTNNTINYAGSSFGVTIDLFNGNAIGSAIGSEAYGDTFSGIQNVIGSTSNDIFYASSEANKFTGNGGVDTVNYQYSDAGVTVNLNTGFGSFGFAAGDEYVGIQNVVGSAHNDTFVANNIASVFNGGSAGSDTVDYSASGQVGVTVNLFNGTGTGGYAQGDSYVSIENVIGTAGNDLFYASAAANNFNGGTGGNDTVSYQFSTGQPIVANLLTGQGTGGDANGDRYISIDNLTGSAFVDSNLTGDGFANILTALGINTTNILDGGAGNDTLDGRLGGHNTLIGGAGDDLFWVKVGADGSTIANVDHITGGDGADTLRIDGLLANLNMTTFLAGPSQNTYKASGITTLDVRDSVSTTLTFTAQDVINMGVNNQLTVRMDGGDTLKVSGNAVAGNGYFAFYDASNTTEVARINFLYA